ncbi:MAG: DUF2807 domain-containing protein [Bacteroidia bacterium]
MDCFKSTGTEITELRTVDKFNIIKSYNKIDVNITKGTEFKVEVVAGKHVMKSIKTIVADGILSLEDKNRCNFVRGYKRKVTVNITMPYLIRVENRGVGTIVFTENYAQDTIHVLAENSGDIYLSGTFNQVKTSSHGNGDIYLSGSCNTLYAYTYGTNLLKAESLTVNNYAFIETISIGDCFINAPNGGTLECNIWRAGNVHYKGNPATVSRFSGDGKGELIKDN